jgi:hypothetical protein
VKKTGNNTTTLATKVFLAGWDGMSSSNLNEQEKKPPLNKKKICMATDSPESLRGMAPFLSAACLPLLHRSQVQITFVHLH